MPPALAAASPRAPQTELLRRLESLCGAHELGALASRLADLAALVAPDMAEFERSLPEMRGAPTDVERSADHLLGLGGKRLRPICVALASRLGTGLDPQTKDLAVSAELIHAATLLHDDVVDMGETRRGAPAARTIFGNAISIFAGDWLLIDALRRVRKAAVPGVLERLLDVIEEMIFAESLQLERRGRLDLDEAKWFEVVDGKTAALFRWAMFAGGRAGGLSLEECLVLEDYGRHLGVAFQAVDDVLDLAGDPDVTGKALFTDVREGKLTYPLIVALERRPELRPLLEGIIADDEVAPEVAKKIRAIVDETGGLDACRALAFEHAALAKQALASLPASPARAALETVADATVHRPL